MRLHQILYRDYSDVGRPARMASLSLGLMFLAWGFLDPYLSIIGMEIFEGDVAKVGYASALLMGVSMLFSLPVADLDSRISSRRGLILGKTFYVLTGISFFLALWHMSALWFVTAYFLNGFGNGLVYTSCDCYIREHSLKGHEALAFGFKAFLSNFMWIIGVIVGALWFVENQGFLFLTVILTALLTVSLFFDIAMPSRRMGGLLIKVKDFLFKNHFFSRSKRHFRKYSIRVKFALLVSFFWSFFDLLTFVFIPLLAFQMGLPLYQIGLLTVTFRIPYLLSFFFSEFAQGKDTYRLLSVSFFGLAFFVALLGFTQSTMGIFVLNLGLAFFLSLIYPIVSGLLGASVSKAQLGEISGLQNSFIRAGGAVGVILFGYFSGENGLRLAFMVFSLLTMGIAFGCLSVRDYVRRQTMLLQLKKDVVG